MDSSPFDEMETIVVSSDGEVRQFSPSPPASPLCTTQRIATVGLPRQGVIAGALTDSDGEGELLTNSIDLTKMRCINF